MLKKLTLPLLGLLIATLAGCGGSRSTSPSASVTAPANVNGTWTGGTTKGAATVTMILKQAGTSVTGNLMGAGATPDGPIEGTVEGNTIRLKERSGFGSTPLLTVKGDQITGNLGGSTLNLRRTMP